jgi:hypothetical protein
MYLSLLILLGQTPTFLASSNPLFNDLVKLFISKGTLKVNFSPSKHPLLASALAGNNELTRYYLEMGMNLINRNGININTLLFRNGYEY